MTRESAAPGDSGWASGARILVVDDEEYAASAVCDFFRVLGCSVDQATTEHAAHLLLDRFAYDALITDLCLSAGGCMEGLRVVAHLRERHPRAICIVLTAFGDSARAEAARRHGADDLLQKPAPLPLLARRLASALGGRR